MKRLNEFFLIDYQKLADIAHDLLNMLTYTFMVAFLLLSGMLALLTHHYFCFRFDQRLASFKPFIFIPIYFIDKMKNYFNGLDSRVGSTENKLANI